jgi:hypothetical protein
MRSAKSRKNLRFYSGVLENAGLTEVAYCLKKAKQNIAYADFAFQNTDFEESKSHIADCSRKLIELSGLIRSVQESIDQAEQSAVQSVIKRDFLDEED